MNYPTNIYTNLIIIAAFIILSIIIFYFNSIYVNGDQVIYRHAYELVEGLNLKEAFYIYNSRLDGHRIPPLIYSWIFSTLKIDKDIALTFLTFILVTYTYIYLRKFNVNNFLTLTILFTNYYLWVLYTTMEQAKLGFIFLILSMIYHNKIFFFLLFSFLALVSHQSYIFIYSGIFFIYLYQIFFQNENKLKNYLLLIICLSFLIYYFIFFFDVIEHKFNVYFSEEHLFKINNFIPILILIAISIFCSKRIIIPILVFLPSLLGIALIGPYRINMLALFISFYFILNYKNGNNIFTYVLSLYLFYKTLIFLNSIFHNGHGF